MNRVALVVFVVACNGTGDDDLLSTSRISLTERTSTRVHVRADALSDVAFDMPEGLAITPITDSNGPALDIAALCNAAHGADTTLLVPIRDTHDGRSATLVVRVGDDSTDACLADITIWDEDCDAGSCNAACGQPPQQLPIDHIAIARGASRRICARSTALDTLQPLDGVTLDLTPKQVVFESRPLIDNTLSLIVHGQPWLVGPFTLTATSHVDDRLIVRSIPVTMGQPGDIDVEVDKPPPLSEFVRSTVDLHVHHFPGPCTIGISQSPTFQDYPFRTRLLDELGNNVDPLHTPLSCEVPHSRFTLAIVAGVDAPAITDVPMYVYDGVTTVPALLAFGVKSQAENLYDEALCPDAHDASVQLLLGCADINGDGALEVVRASKVKSCLVPVASWRQPDAGSAATIAVSGIGRVLSIPTPTLPRILAVDDSGKVRQLVLLPSPQWQLTTIGPLASDADAIPMRTTGSAGPPDVLAALSGGATVQFAQLDGSRTDSVSIAGPNQAIAVGAFDLGSNGQGLVVVRTTHSTIYGIEAYSVQWTVVPPKLTLVATGMITAMPSDAFVSVEARGTNQELIVAFHTTQFASAVTEARISGGSIDTIVQYGSVISIAGVPDRSVLLGAASGAVLTTSDAMGSTYTSIDPVPPGPPSPTYGASIAPCLDATGQPIGFIERSDVGVRIAKFGLVPEDP